MHAAVTVCFMHSKVLVYKPTDGEPHKLAVKLSSSRIWSDLFRGTPTPT